MTQATPENLRFKFLSETQIKYLRENNPNLKSDPNKYCPTCKKRGTYFWKNEDQECDCQLQLQMHKHYLKAGIGMTYQRLSWDDYSGDEDAKMICEWYVNNAEDVIDRGMGVMFLGEFGTGKTMSLTLLLKSLVWLGYDCYSTTFTSMIEMFTAGWKSAEEQTRFQDRVKRSDVLLLDDLGKEMRTKTNLAESTFDDVLRSRVQAGMPTLLTSNLEVDDLDKDYGAAVLSLLKEVSIVHTFKGKDFRQNSHARGHEEMRAGITRPIQ